MWAACAGGFPPHSCLRHQRAWGTVPPGRIPGTQPSGTGEGTEGEGIPAQRDLSLAFGSGLRLALILQREMARPCWEFELGHAEAPAALGCLCS